MSESNFRRELLEQARALVFNTGADAAALFQNMAVTNLRGKYQSLLASPYGIRDRVMELLDREIAKGEEGYVFLKLNSITDRQLIDKLAQALAASVKGQEPVPVQEEAPKPKGFVCKICGFIYESDTLPDDFVCPICRRPASDFEPVQ